VCRNSLNGVVAKRSLAASSISRLAAPSEHSQHRADHHDAAQDQRRARWRKIEARLERVSLTASQTGTNQKLAPNRFGHWERSVEHGPKENLGPEGEPRIGKLGYWETLHPRAVEIVSDTSEVVRLLLCCPPSAVEAKGGTPRLAPRQ
jgi:hypothetical protein